MSVNAHCTVAHSGFIHVEFVVSANAEQLIDFGYAKLIEADVFTKLRLGTCNNLISMAYPLNFDICAAMKKIQSFHSNSRPLKLVWSFGKSFTNATPIEAKIHWICVIIYWLDSFN